MRRRGGRRCEAKGVWLAAALAAGASWLGGRGDTLADDEYGPRAALRYEASTRGPVSAGPHRYPEARGVAFEHTRHIVPMHASLWRPAELARDFRRRSASLPPHRRPVGLIVVLKTERCSTKWARSCAITTAVLEKRASPALERFVVYGAWLESRSGEEFPGARRIEEGADAWKNEAAGLYRFVQGPGAQLIFLDPRSGRIMERRDAVELGLYEEEFTRAGGRTPRLDAQLSRILGLLGEAPAGVGRER